MSVWYRTQAAPGAVPPLPGFSSTRARLALTRAILTRQCIRVDLRTKEKKGHKKIEKPGKNRGTTFNNQLTYFRIS
jgi:hypothetical protein